MSASTPHPPHASGPFTAHVWRGTEVAPEAQVLPTGHALLDAHLPGGGWPVGSLIELLQDRPEAHAWQLLLPALSSWAGTRAGPVVLVGAPCVPFTPSLAAQGLPAARLLWIRAAAAPARLWSAEQSLRCADVIAVIAWLPQARTAELRRLQLAARQHAKLLFVLRDAAQRLQASPAPLRLWLQGVDTLQVHIVKRKGPPVDGPLMLSARPVRLEALLASRRRPVPAELPSSAVEKPASVPVTDLRRSDVLDRLVPAG